MTLKVRAVIQAHTPLGNITLLINLPFYSSTFCLSVDNYYLHVPQSHPRPPVLVLVIFIMQLHVLSLLCCALSLGADFLNKVQLEHVLLSCRDKHTYTVSPSAPGKQIYLIAAVSDWSEAQIGFQGQLLRVNQYICVRGQTQQRHKHCLDSQQRLRAKMCTTLYMGALLLHSDTKESSVCVCVCPISIHWLCGRFFD